MSTNKKKKKQTPQDDFEKGLKEILECLELVKIFPLEDIDMEEEITAQEQDNIEVEE